MKQNELMSTNCPYLDTIQRHMLDFDFEKICSVSLSNMNVYACLVCGRYFQGRGKSSPAYLHSLNDNHHVFINLKSFKVYCLPDNYEVVDSSFYDIQYVLHPTFTHDEIERLDTENKVCLDLNKKQYIPGFVGLNNIKANDYVNVVIQTLIHVTPIRNYFLMMNTTYSQNEKGKGGINSDSLEHLMYCFEELCRKVWNSKAYKGQVSPHELLQAISNISNKKYSLTKQADSAEFFTWLLNTLCMYEDPSYKKKRKKNVFMDAFQGKIIVMSRKAAEPSLMEDKKTTGEPPKMVTTSFLHLQLDLPPPPLYQDELQRNIIPQVSILQLLEKYNLSTPQDLGDVVKHYKIIKLPKYLIFYYKRFLKSNWNLEKNPTVVNFPLTGLEVYSERDGLAKFNIIASISHEGKPGPGNGNFKLSILRKATQQWYEIQDLLVKEILPQVLFMSESYIQVWERAI